ncbi:MAG: leucine-rich repeat domain-containing protein [Muribaculaceae bacterium]
MDNKITKSIADLFSNTLKALENEAISPKAYKLVEKAFADATKLLGAAPASAPGVPAAADTSAITAVDLSVSGPYFVVNGEVVKLKSTTLPKAAVKRKASIKSVIIPDCVTEIGDEAFHECKNMETIAIGQGIKKIGVRAFCNCSTLKSVVIPDSVTEIGYAAFLGCDFEVRFFDELINVPDSFRGKYVIPDGIRVIREWCFSGVKNLSEVVIPKSVTTIGRGVFSGCSSLTEVKVDKGNKTFDSRDNCNAIIETATNTLVSGCKTSSIPSSVTKIGATAFYNCSDLTSITIPNSVSEIGDCAFQDCSGLLSVTLPITLTALGSSNFLCFSYPSYWTCVKAIYIPKGSKAKFEKMLHDDMLKEKLIEK